MFQDEDPKSFQYDEEQYKFFLGDPETGEVWDKGKNFSSLRFIQIKNLSHRKSKSYYSHEKDLEKIQSIQKKYM